MIVALDDGVGQVMQTLANHNLLGNTLIIFLSDNGAPNYDWVRNAPFRGYKFDTLEGGIHVPFVLRWDGHLPEAVVLDPAVSSLDIVATVAAAAGVALPTDRVYDGVNLLPYLQGTQTMPDRTLFWRWFGLGPTGPSGSANTLYAARQGALKLVVEAATSLSPPELYNLTNDIGETQNLADSNPADVARLLQSYNNWNVDMVAPFFQFNSSFLSGLPDAIAIAGDWNNFGVYHTEPPWGLSWITAPGTNGTPDGINWFSGIIHAAATGGDTTPGTHKFVLVGGQTYANQWGGISMAVDAINSVPYFSGTGLGPRNSITLSDGFYYSFRVLDPGLELTGPLSVAVMKTSNPPVTLTLAGQAPEMPMPGDPITVTIAINQAKSPEERIYLRWTTDTYITSKMVPVTGSGTTYTATIPGQLANTSVQYTAVSSTIDLSALTTSGAIDPLILATTDSYHAAIHPAPTPTPTPTPMPPGSPQIVQQPADASVKLGRSVRFQVVAHGRIPLRYQWRKNGTNIPGATNPGYKTPPATSQDNGAAFSVTVSNDIGSVTSRDAILTVRPE
jgi:hypothetical protein